MTVPDFQALRHEMVDRQIVGRGVRDRRVLEAMRTVPREAFVAERLAESAYDDSPLPIAEEQTISQPYVVALMAEALEIRPEDKVLEIGAGSGYAAAVLSRLGREVYAVERHESLVREAEERLARLGYSNVRFLHGDGTLGWPEHAPYDAIVVAAGGPDVPPALLDQLAEGGRLVIPIGPDPRNQDLVRVRRGRRAVRIARDSAESSCGRRRALIGAQGWSWRSPRIHCSPCGCRPKDWRGVADGRRGQALRDRTSLFGRRRTPAGIPRTLFLTLLGEYGVPSFRLTEEELRRDLENAWVARQDLPVTVDSPQPINRPPEGHSMNRLKPLLPLLCLGLACLPAPVRAADETARLHDLFHREWEYRLKEDPRLATTVGRHEYDDRLPEISTADLARRAAAGKAFLAELAAIDRSKLSAWTPSTTTSSASSSPTGSPPGSWARTRCRSMPTRVSTPNSPGCRRSSRWPR